MAGAKKRILLFYPHNFIEMSTGSYARVHGLVEYLNARGFVVDLLSLNGFNTIWDEDSLRKGKTLFENIYLCEWKPFRKLFAVNILKDLLTRRLTDFALPKLHTQVREILSRQPYAFFIVSYAYWAKLAEEVPREVSTVIDLHDFITLNEHMTSGRKKYKPGRKFQDEVDAINSFDHALSISEEETLVFAPFCPNTRFINAPIAFPERFQAEDAFAYDLMCIGSANPFNKEGITWFMKRVYPLLPPTVKIAIVGKMTQFVSHKPNITLIPYADKLDEIYAASEVVFCPLKSGTGLKVKVVEALSYGKPMVTTRWGLTGMLQKERNGCIRADDEGSFAAALQRLLTDAEYYRAVQSEGMAYFREKFARDSCWKNLDTVFLGSK